METPGAYADGYLLTTNYRAILDYNCSNFYAIGRRPAGECDSAAIDEGRRPPPIGEFGHSHARQSCSPPPPLCCSPLPLRPPRRSSIPPARVAYLIDLSSGAVLYAKNADTRMPPASMAKMMTTEVAFELIDKGQLPLEQDVHGAPRDLAEVARARRPARPCSCRPTSRSASRICCKGIVTLSGNDASVVLAECIAGTEQAFAEQMNALGKKLGLTNSHFGNANGWPDEGVTYVTARDLATLARAEIENHHKLYKKFYSLPSFTWGKTLGSGQGHHPGQPQSDPGQSAGRGRPEDRPHRRSGLRLHRLGRAERTPPDRGRRRSR